MTHPWYKTYGMTFDEAVHLYAATDQSDILRKIASFAESRGFRRRAVANLMLERRLPSSTWREILDAIRRAASADDLQGNLVKCFRNHLLEAVPISTVVTIFGRAISTYRFADLLTDAGLSRSEAARATARILAMPVSELNKYRIFVPWKLGRAVWATFTPLPATGTPVFSRGMSADHIRGFSASTPSNRESLSSCLSTACPLALSRCTQRLLKLMRAVTFGRSISSQQQIPLRTVSR